MIPLTKTSICKSKVNFINNWLTYLTVSISLFLFSINGYSQIEYNLHNDEIVLSPEKTIEEKNKLDVYCQFNASEIISDFSNLEPLVLNVFFHLIKDEDGNNATFNPSETDLLEAVAALNIQYNEFQIFFKYNGYQEILNSEYLSIRNSNCPNTDIKYAYQLKTYTQEYPVNNEDDNFYKEYSMNLFIVDYIYSGSSCSLVGGLGNTGKNAFFVYGALNSSNLTLKHEIGHCFFLKHPHYSYNNTNPYYREHVTNDENSLDYNAVVAGDYVVDTRAAYPYPEVDDDTCEYIYNAAIVDDVGTPYEQLPTDNIMSYSHPKSCLTEFTNGQGTRMRCAIETFLSEAMSDISSLYEPYKTVYGSYYNKYYYQPGFDYKFVKCGPQGAYPEPSEYNDISFSFDLSSNAFHYRSFDKFHSAFNDIYPYDKTAVLIPILDNNQPRKCYNTLLKGGASSGTVVKYLDGTRNYNYTVNQLDSLQINNPELINNLENGLYDIKKQYQQGDVDEKTILKLDD